MGGGKNEGFKMAVLFFFFAENYYICCNLKYLI